MLLHAVRSPQSFDHLRTYEGVLYDDVQNASRARHLLRDDREWDVCLGEAAGFQLGNQLRQYSSIITCDHDGVDVQRLYTRHFHTLSGDTPRLLDRDCGLEDPPLDQIRDTCLVIFQKATTSVDPARDLLCFRLPQPPGNVPIVLARFNALNDEQLKYYLRQSAERIQR